MSYFNEISRSRAFIQRNTSNHPCSFKDIAHLRVMRYCETRCTMQTPLGVEQLSAMAETQNTTYSGDLSDTSQRSGPDHLLTSAVACSPTAARVRPRTLLRRKCHRRGRSVLQWRRPLLLMDATPQRQHAGRADLRHAREISRKVTHTSVEAEHSKNDECDIFFVFFFLHFWQRYFLHGKVW